MSQATSRSRPRSYLSARWLVVAALVVAAVAAAALHRQWLPHAQRLLVAAGLSKSNRDQAHAAATDASQDAHDHAGHDHAGPSDADSLKMSPQARKNIGLQVAQVKLQPFTKTIGVPGMVVERPGRSTIEVTALMTGIITKIYPIEGEAIPPGQKLFELRLTHEELVQSQADLLQTAEELDVTLREIKRIEKLTQEGALAGKQLLERQYERQKQEAVLRSKRQALLLHGLTDAQVDEIIQRRELLKQLTVIAPTANDEGDTSPAGTMLQVQSLRVSSGQHVNAGDTLAVLADHAELYIEGEAFERDIAHIGRAAETKASVSAIMNSEGGKPEVIPNLRILYLAAKVNPETRTLDFFVKLPNEKLRDARLDNGHRFITWKFRPGQRVQLQIPIETLPDRIVLPIEAVAQDGVETYVFTPNGDHFDRRSVHLEYRDPQWAVLTNDGSLFPGDWVAISGAQQLQLALKNKAGGGIDPHAGHNH